MVTKIIFDKLKDSGFLDLYLLFGFVLSLSFFILNFRDYKPIEVFFGIIFFTIFIKSLINIILGFLVKYQKTEEIKEDNKYQDELANIELLLSKFNIQTLNKSVKNDDMMLDEIEKQSKEEQKEDDNKK